MLEQQQNNNLQLKSMNSKKLRKVKRHYKIRQKVKGTEKIPRLTVYKSNKYIYASLIDDTKGTVLAVASDQKLTKKSTKVENAMEVGKLIAKLAIDKKIKSIVFDRGGYTYHGRVKSLAEGARSGGLNF